MKKWGLRSLLFLLLPAFLLAGGVLSAAAVDGVRDDEGARRLAQMVNREREHAGMDRLPWDDRLAEAARRHALVMSRHGELSHQFPGEAGLRDRVAALGPRFNDDAENVAYDSTVEEAHANLMQSPGHRANILNPRYNAIGVAVIRHNGRVYVVEDFVRGMAEDSDPEVAASVLAAFNRKRRAARLAPVPQVRDLHDAACHMAEVDKVSAAGISVAGASSVVAFTTFEADDLPASVLTRAADPRIARVALGACFARTPNYPSGIEWVVMAYYPRSAR